MSETQLDLACVHRDPPPLLYPPSHRQRPADKRPCDRGHQCAHAPRSLQSFPREAGEHHRQSDSSESVWRGHLRHGLSGFNLQSTKANSYFSRSGWLCCAAFLTSLKLPSER
ncbi:uncharacterized protein K441DRAFT_247986 [Cenococcum geophilum 1.58]|uniref:uncharacterized protein n=1 Tax=Cenococcum geophilum 1.58 TaxID=794803 RepID=UPI00358E0904|nr:hypothetical protein K441DRAFT_247986 [Cenococcum geophilum 1.58]